MTVLIKDLHFFSAKKKISRINKLMNNLAEMEDNKVGVQLLVEHILEELVEEDLKVTPNEELEEHNELELDLD